MSDKCVSNLHTLPVELVNRILDHLNNQDILWSMENVCTRINAIVQIYLPYQVNFFLNENYPLCIIVETAFIRRIDHKSY